MAVVLERFTVTVLRMSVALPELCRSFADKVPAGRSTFAVMCRVLHGTGLKIDLKKIHRSVLSGPFAGCGPFGICPGVRPVTNPAETDLF